MPDHYYDFSVPASIAGKAKAILGEVGRMKVSLEARNRRFQQAMGLSGGDSIWMPTCREDSNSSRRADNDKLLALCLDIPVGLARTLSARTVFVLLTGLVEVNADAVKERMRRLGTMTGSAPSVPSPMTGGRSTLMVMEVDSMEQVPPPVFAEPVSGTNPSLEGLARAGGMAYRELKGQAVAHQSVTEQLAARQAQHTTAGENLEVTVSRVAQVINEQARRQVKAEEHTAMVEGAAEEAFNSVADRQEELGEAVMQMAKEKARQDGVLKTEQQKREELRQRLELQQNLLDQQREEQELQKQQQQKQELQSQLAQEQQQKQIQQQQAQQQQFQEDQRKLEEQLRLRDELLKQQQVQQQEQQRQLDQHKLAEQAKSNEQQLQQQQLQQQQLLQQEQNKFQQQEQRRLEESLNAQQQQMTQQQQALQQQALQQQGLLLQQRQAPTAQDGLSTVLSQMATTLHHLVPKTKVVAFPAGMCRGSKVKRGSDKGFVVDLDGVTGEVVLGLIGRRESFFVLTPEQFKEEGWLLAHWNAEVPAVQVPLEQAAAQHTLWAGYGGRGDVEMSLLRRAITEKFGEGGSQVAKQMVGLLAKTVEATINGGEEVTLGLLHEMLEFQLIRGEHGSRSGDLYLKALAESWEDPTTAAARKVALKGSRPAGLVRGTTTTGQQPQHFPKNGGRGRGN